MALCHNCDETKIEYTGNGSKTDYTFPFEYNDKRDVEVAYWDDELLVWEKINRNKWVFQNETTIRFNDAPLARQKFIIYRCTDLSPLPAEFYPGTAIKADDLNDNFFVLKSAIEEARCAIERNDNKSEERYWNTAPYTKDGEEGETVYYDVDEDYWKGSDDAVATTKAIANRFWNKAGETTIIADDWNSETDDRHVPTTGAVDRYVKKVIDNENNIIRPGDFLTKEQQESGIVDNNLSNNNALSSAASKSRHDSYVQAPKPAEPLYEQPGKNWFDTGILENYTWDPNAGAWISISRTGQVGKPGDEGPQGPSGVVIISDTAPTEHPNGGSEGKARPLMSGDQWFHSEKTQLFIYYKDNMGPQWVSVTAKGPKGDPGDGTNTFEAPLQEDSITKAVTFNINSLTRLS